MAWASTDENPPEPTAGVRTSHVLIVGGLQGETTTISPAEFAQLPRTEIEASVPHSDQQAKYEGVLLDRLFQEAGVRPGDPESGTQLARPFRSAYVLIEAADGYQVVLSIAEVFPQLGGRGVLLADRKNGQPLEAKAAPYQLVVIDSVGHERWVRQVTRILVRPASASPFPGHTAVPEPTAETALAGGVFVVGTGPGAPDLITVRAANILRRADRVYCFSWMKDELAPFVQSGVVEVASPWLRGGQYCGQDPAACAPELRAQVVQTNEELGRLRAQVQSLVADGKTVVFADNGDPTIFSPWSWVPAHLPEFAPTVVPGLSSFNAGNAALKRGVAGLGSVTISSGTDTGVPDSHGRLSGTLAFFTHLKKFDVLLPELQKKYPADTPVAIVCDVSYPAEKVVEGTLGTILEVLGDPPALPHLYLLYVGDGLKPVAGCH
jgi:precorrin-4 methylase